MTPLTGSQRDFLRSKAHPLKPLVFVGRQGVTDSLIVAVEENLTAHELIKVKFINLKDQKRALSEEIARRTVSDLVGLVGNVATLYRQHSEPEKRRIDLPD
jgi:RNA-binding protein